MSENTEAYKKEIKELIKSQKNKINLDAKKIEKALKNIRPK
jgi:hypothetical protein